jgi:hypothetical protein
MVLQFKRVLAMFNASIRAALSNQRLQLAVFWVRIFNFVPAGFVFSNHRNPQTLGFVA